MRWFAFILLLAGSVRAQNLTGTWNWVEGQTLVVAAGGTCEVYQGASKINDCRWESLGARQYRLTHRSGGYVDTVTLSSDGNSLSGTNNQGFNLRGSRKMVVDLTGTWNWVEGQTLVVLASGTCEVFQGGNKINDCRWESLGGGRYRLTHRSGGYVDNVTLSADGTALSGTNNQGFNLRGSRRNVADLAGTWNWVEGQTLVVAAGGTCEVFQGGNKINDCRWESLGARQYRLTHRSGGYVDTVTLSADANSLSGTNNQGFNLRGTRR
jgi:hypothetical protein